jgi:predicted nucleic acid-binding protein
MAVNALVDTGALLALLDSGDGWHGLCVEAFRKLQLPLLTSEAVLTELFHLVGGTRHEMEAAWKLIDSGAIEVAVIQNSELAEIHSLMSRYWDRPMDFADATLVYLARRESLTNVFTVDQADFETYRIEGRRRFRVIPDRRR